MAFIVFEGMAIFLLVLLIPVLYTHVPLACSNRTAIENNYANTDNPYDLGLRQANLEQILGVFGYDWFIPMKPLNPQTDGISFLRKDDPAGSMDTSIDKTDMLQAESLWRMRYQIQNSTPDPEFGPLRSISRWLTGEGDAGDDDGSPVSPANHQVTAGCGPWRPWKTVVGSCWFTRWFKPWPFDFPVGGHDSPLKGSLNHPNKVTKNCQAGAMHRSSRFTLRGSWRFCWLILGNRKDYGDTIAIFIYIGACLKPWRERESGKMIVAIY